jgi:hypothetical protein
MMVAAATVHTTGWALHQTIARARETIVLHALGSVQRLW